MDDESQIRELMDDWREALSARDLDRLIKHYDPDVLFFDAVPPYQHKGAEAYRRTWEAMFSFLSFQLCAEMREISITVSGDLAVMHCLNQLVNAETKQPATCGWVRVTTCYARTQGAWRVIHEHVSVPFDPMSGQASFIHQP